MLRSNALTSPASLARLLGAISQQRATICTCSTPSLERAYALLGAQSPSPNHSKHVAQQGVRDATAAAHPATATAGTPPNCHAAPTRCQQSVHGPFSSNVTNITLLSSSTKSSSIINSRLSRVVNSTSPGTNSNNSRAFCSSSTSSIDEQDHNFVGAYTPITKTLWQERLKLAQQQQAHPPQQQQQQQQAGAASSSGPPPKPPQKTVVNYPFTKDKFLLEMYRNPWGFLRMGRLLEDLDSLAGSIAFQHCHTPGAGPPLLVTAAVDAIEYARPALLSADMVCQGQVVFTGGSSLDIRMELLQEPHAPEPSLVALFSFVLLHPASKRPSQVPQLTPVTPQEVHWAAERAQVAAARKAARKAATTDGGGIKLSPDQQRQLQDALAASRLLLDMPALADPLALTAEETSLSNTFVCQPQQRNMHGRIFGGFLMRRAFELAFATTYLFAGSRPAFVRVEDITFRSPVDVGSLLRFKSHVVNVTYKGPQEAHVAIEVEAVVTQPEHKTTTHTNTFRYVFGVKLEAGQQLRRVLPATPADVQRLIRCLADSEP